MIGRKQTWDGTYRGKRNDNPILDIRVYEVEFIDGTRDEYLANAIAESMHSQCDMEGNQYLLLKSIVDYRKHEKVDSLYLLPCNQRSSGRRRVANITYQY